MQLERAAGQSSHHPALEGSELAEAADPVSMGQITRWAGGTLHAAQCLVPIADRSEAFMAKSLGVAKLRNYHS